MSVKFAHIIVTSSDLKEARKFYCDCLGLKITNDFEVCFLVQDNYLMLHDSKAFSTNIFKVEKNQYQGMQGTGNINIYFESDDLEALFSKVVEQGYKLIHPIELQPWNQKVFRVYDPDGHIVEIGAPLWKTFEV